MWSYGATIKHYLLISLRFHQERRKPGRHLISHRAVREPKFSSCGPARSSAHRARHQQRTGPTLLLRKLLTVGPTSGLVLLCWTPGCEWRWSEAGARERNYRARDRAQGWSKLLNVPGAPIPAASICPSWDRLPLHSWSSHESLGGSWIFSMYDHWQ